MSGLAWPGPGRGVELRDGPEVSSFLDVESLVEPCGLDGRASLGVPVLERPLLSLPSRTSPSSSSKAMGLFVEGL